MEREGAAALRPKVIYVCSPLKGDISANIAKAREHCKTVIGERCMPYAPHIVFDGILDDNDPAERKKALKIGLEMLKRCDELWVFGDVVSEGMKAEIEVASREQIRVRFRSAKLLNTL